ncbi:MAG: hypothetical protein CM15mV145_250 [uncultured marine virus]|nr:MAG: hypothetical protein CM15mV145_250 [uncultured marine virus]
MPKQYCFRVKAKTKKQLNSMCVKIGKNLQKTEVKGSPYDTRTTNVTHGRILCVKKFNNGRRCVMRKKKTCLFCGLRTTLR